MCLFLLLFLTSCEKQTSTEVLATLVESCNDVNNTRQVSFTMFNAENFTGNKDIVFVKEK